VGSVSKHKDEESHRKVSVGLGFIYRYSNTVGLVWQQVTLYFYRT
jgi:hypothetical protein